ncbi:hypothetical protein C8Q75DRAFT_309124 [Abortiporus biennis]|nr:hypothetical protein C8Q75DRAFT_309124 [Abortiporus biennis]
MKPISVAILVVDINLLLKGSRSESTICLKLPAPVDSEGIRNAEISVSPNVPTSTSYTSNTFKPPPFHYSDDEHILAFEFGYDFESGGDSAYFTGFVKARTLVSLFKSMTGMQNRTLEWTEWGPERTRIFKIRNVISSLCGPRFIFVHKRGTADENGWWSDDEEEEEAGEDGSDGRAGEEETNKKDFVFSIIDFSDAALKSVAETGTNTGSGVTVVTESRELKMGNEANMEVEMTCGEYLTTALPYCKYEVDIPIALDPGVEVDDISLLLGEDSIVMMLENEKVAHIYSI